MKPPKLWVSRDINSDHSGGKWNYLWIGGLQPIRLGNGVYVGHPANKRLHCFGQNLFDLKPGECRRVYLKLGREEKWIESK